MRYFWVPLLLLVLFLLAMLGGWWWSQKRIALPIDLQQEKVTQVKEVLVAEEPGPGVELVNREAMLTLANSVPVEKRPEQIAFYLHNELPETLDEMVSITKGTRVGTAGVGMGCGAPQYSQEDNTVRVDVYATVGKLLLTQSPETIESDLTRMINKCLAWGVASLTVDETQISAVVDQAVQQPSSLSLVKLTL